MELIVSIGLFAFAFLLGRIVVKLDRIGDLMRQSNMHCANLREQCEHIARTNMHILSRMQDDGE